MGKYIARHSENTQVLYKKSNITCNTFSKTCSEGSQFTKSSISKIKKNVSKSNIYYTDGKTIKRDLCIETGNCILRRYFKRKRAKLSGYDESSVKSKRTIQLETDDFSEEFKPDTVASGDNEHRCETVKHNQRGDITSLMLENLKSLLNDWICKHVFEYDETKQKLIQIFDSIMHSIENKISEAPSSCSTYVLERNGERCKVRNRKIETNSLICQYCKQKQTSLIVGKNSSILYKKYSHFTVPVPCKRLRIISTLSIPRNMHKNKKTKKHEIKSNEVRKSNGDNSIGANNNCKPNPDKVHRKKHNKMRGIIIFPDVNIPLYESTTDCTSSSVNNIVEKLVDIETDDVYVEPNQSLLKSIYENNPANTEKITECENKNDIFTMKRINFTHTMSSTSNKKIHESHKEIKDTVCESRKFQKRNKISADSKFTRDNCHSKRIRKYGTTRTKTPIKCKKLYYKPRDKGKCKNEQLKFDNIKYRKFTYLYRKTNRNIYTKDFFNHIRNILRYFSAYKGKRNIKLEVHVDVYPSIEVERQISNIIKKPSNNFELNISPTSIFNTEPILLSDLLESGLRTNVPRAESIPEIVPLLDGATSQVKYVFRSNNSTSICKSEDVKIKSVNECGTVMSGLEVCKELSELKGILRDLSTTTEKIVVEHLRRKITKNNTRHTSVATEAPINEKKVIPKQKSESKGIQLSNIPRSSQLTSGLKLFKEPKKIEETSNKLKKPSSSYHVIESESIIRVTDMTSALAKSKLHVNKSRSPHKSNSSLNTTKRIKDKNRRTLAFFYNERKKNKRYHDHTQSSKKIIKCSSPQNLSFRASPMYKQRLGESIVLPVQLKNCKTNSDHDFVPEIPPTSDHDYICGLPSCSSVCIEIDNKPTLTVKSKDNLTFFEGCIYCVLLWIPLIILIYFFYDYVLKDLLKPSKNSKTPEGSSSENEKPPNISQFLLKLSDFGF
ncbi:unnamed protein product [Diatraea saccharalis]|uniref:Uncharacterized protein n=1 Tax=Diatraea saccharalis TaxID=40085 RepID=A0A9N9WD70_9NEOP|nr:unnamed protein product [Diatraea saccharalis]